MGISLKIDDLGLLYKVDVLSYASKINSPIAKKIDETGKVFYRKSN